MTNSQDNNKSSSGNNGSSEATNTRDQQQQGGLTSTSTDAEEQIPGMPGKTSEQDEPGEENMKPADPDSK